MKKQVKLYNVKGNPNNSSIIKNDKFKKLVKSIEEFPEMLKLRPIVVDEDMMVLGGNMRLKASKEAGLNEVWVDVAEGLTEAQKREFVIKDNVGFGEWDWDLLANDWSNQQIASWGLDVWQPEEIDFNPSLEPSTDYSDVTKEEIEKLGLGCKEDVQKDIAFVLSLTNPRRKQILKIHFEKTGISGYNLANMERLLRECMGVADGLASTITAILAQ